MAMLTRVKTAIFAGLTVVSLAAGAANAAQCGNNAAGFETWKRQFEAEALRMGISQRTLARSMNGVTYDPQVIRLDRNQKSFKLSLDQFMQRRAPASYVTKAKNLMKQNAALLSRIEQRYGVQPEILMAIWGMETGFGANSGNMSVIRSLSTLAYDCRRSAFFTNELIAALHIVERGDMTPEQLRGAWAGEIGQTQFLASNYDKFGVDGDGNGHVDLIRSRADVLASTANFLKQHGWRAGAGYQPGEPNFRVLQDWNRATVYQQALALFASKIAK
ncbi:lytic murein transglycosylase [Limoniibacter endophyticus]|uniref:Lytic transglycosylase n=1 Tax=Limoniibacter endophyticus TaxID=1565040 RepID=A0A8J3DJP4_9HYPH|nr:lytic murein transglycosylase [Limoniibacter endophyticus]GHC74270.1 lytic transglycosylase [Limoniibacter endophyticus]